MVQEKEAFGKPTGWGKRHTFTILGFVGFAISYAIRFNISITIVAMVKSTISSAPNIHPLSPLNHVCVYKKVNGQHFQFLNGTMSIPGSSEDEGEFDWDEQVQSYILGSFFWGYMLTQLPGGILSHHFGGKWLFGVGILIPGILALVTPIASRLGGPGWLMAVRMMQGLGGGLTMSAAHGLIAKWIPKEERSTLTAVIYAGMSFGSGITMLVSGYLSHFAGWDFVFYTTGIVAIVWFALWSLLTYENPSLHPSISQEELRFIGSAHFEQKSTLATPWKEIFTSYPFWAIIIAHFCETWALYTLMTEIPTYLKTMLQFDMKENSLISAIPYFTLWLFSLIISHIGNILLKRKLASVTFVRKASNTIALWGVSTFLLLVAFSGCNRILAVTFMTISVGILGGFVNGVLSNHIDIAPRFASILMGISNTAATAPGFLAPLVAGQLLHGNATMEQWQKVFFIGSGISFFGNLFYIIFAEGVEQAWARPKPALQEHSIVPDTKFWKQIENESKGPA